MAHEHLIHRLSRLCIHSKPHTSLQHTARRTLSTSTSLHEEQPTSEQQEPINAAPPIDFARKEHKGDGLPPLERPNSRTLNRLRVVPASRSYFTAQPRFIDDYLKAASLLAKYAHLPRITPSLLPRATYQTHETYRSTLAEPIKPTAYARLITLLRRLQLIHPTLMPDDVSALLARFRRIVNPNANKAKPIFVDEAGRARAVGRRKESVAVVYLVEGEGEVRVNGRTLTQVFSRQHDRDSAVWPLAATGRVDKYNVWAIVRGGGVTGQAEAVTLGIARALLVHEPGLKPALRRAGVVTRDPRMVERKKPGHRKARKMPTWVKR